MKKDFSQSFDARDWAAAFKSEVEKKPSIATDEGTLVAWFANAIMRGYDEHARKYPTDALISAVGHFDHASKTDINPFRHRDKVLRAAFDFARPHVDERGIELDVLAETR